MALSIKVHTTSTDDVVSVYKKKPVEVSAIRWNGDNFDDIKAFAGDNVSLEDDELIIKTLEDGKDGKAKHAASVGDYVIRGVAGEFYFCKPKIFKDTYEYVSESKE